MSTYLVTKIFIIISYNDQHCLLHCTTYYSPTFSTTTFSYWCIHPHGSQSHGKCWIWESLLLHPQTDRTASVSLLPCTLPRKWSRKLFIDILLSLYDFDKETSLKLKEFLLNENVFHAWNKDIIKHGIHWLKLKELL